MMARKEENILFKDGYGLTVLASAVADAGFVISGAGRRKMGNKWADVLIAETPHQLAYHIEVVFSVFSGKTGCTYFFETEKKSGSHLTARMLTHRAWKAVHDIMAEEEADILCSA